MSLAQDAGVSALDRPARVLIICNSPDNGGGANLLYRVTRYLDKARVQPTLLLHHDGWQAEQQRIHGHADTIIEPDIGVLNPVPALRADNLPEVVGAIGATTLGWARVARRVARLAGERQFDVLAGFGNAPALLATAAGTLAPRPVIWSAQRCYDNLLESLPFQALAVAPAVRRIFAVSRAAAEPFAHVPDKLEIAYNGIDPEEVDPNRIRGTLRARHAIGPAEVLVGMAGRMIELKGGDLFLLAAGKLAAKYPAVRFVLIGKREGDDFDRRLDEIVHGAGLQHRVIFTGWVDDIYTEMRDLDVVAIPSRRDAAPLVAYEAMALGRAIVATRCPGLDEQFEDERSGLYVPRNDVDALARALDRVLGDAELRGRLGRAARETVCARFNIRRMVGRVEETIVRLRRDPRANLEPTADSQL
jgi:glycosyltransferase involved in cell wall biosynthesis